MLIAAKCKNDCEADMLVAVLGKGLSIESERVIDKDGHVILEIRCGDYASIGTVARAMDLSKNTVGSYIRRGLVEAATIDSVVYAKVDDALKASSAAKSQSLQEDADTYDAVV